MDIGDLLDKSDRDFIILDKMGDGRLLVAPFNSSPEFIISVRKGKCDLIWDRIKRALDGGVSEEYVKSCLSEAKKFRTVEDAQWAIIIKELEKLMGC